MGRDGREWKSIKWNGAWKWGGVVWCEGLYVNGRGWDLNNKK